MEILQAFLPILSKPLTSYTRVKLHSGVCPLMINSSITTIGKSGLLISFLTALFHVKQLWKRRSSLLLKRRRITPMLQKALEALVNFVCEFIIAHPRIMTSIIGVLAALALIACVVAMNLLIGG